MPCSSSKARRLLQFAFALSLLPSLASLGQTAPASDQDNPPPGVYRVGGEVAAPHIIYRVDPEYSDKARKAKINGTVVVSLIVAADGRVRDVQVIKSLTPDLDRKAIEAFRKWKFSPATKDGQPVAVQIEAEASFKLY